KFTSFANTAEALQRIYHAPGRHASQAFYTSRPANGAVWPRQTDPLQCSSVTGSDPRLRMTIEVTFLEQDGQQPQQVAGLLAEFLAGARASLHLAIYDFRLSQTLAEPVVKALRDRAAAGVEIRIAYDAGKLATSFRQASADPAPPGT